MTMTCNESEALLATALLAAPLDEGDEAALRAHLLTCNDCPGTARQFAAIVAQVPLALDPVGPPARLRARLLATAYSTPSPARPHPSPRTRSTPLRSRLRTLAAVGAMAAIAAVAFVTARLTTSTTAPPTLQTVAVNGTTSAPSAHGSLVFDPGTQQTVLSMTGLTQPTATPGVRAPVYEVWLLRADHSTKGVAFLIQQPDGSWTAAWHDDLRQFATIAATVEPFGGSPGPTSALVVQAALTLR